MYVLPLSSLLWTREVLEDLRCNRANLLRKESGDNLRSLVGTPEVVTQEHLICIQVSGDRDRAAEEEIPLLTVSSDHIWLLRCPRFE